MTRSRTLLFIAIAIVAGFLINFFTWPNIASRLLSPVRVHHVDRAGLAIACRNVAGGYDSSVNGCMIRGSRPCTIYVLNESAEEARRVEAHERAHCAGWRHQ